MSTASIGLSAATLTLLGIFLFALWDYRRICRRSGIRPFPPSTEQKRGATGSAVPDAPIHGGNP
jgi:hypothetical protein